MATNQQRRENNAAQKAKARNERERKKLDKAQEQLDALPPADPGSKAEARRKELQKAIDDKKASLDKQDALLDDFIKSEDEAERDDLQDKIDDEREEYRDTSGLGGGKVGDPCAPCTIEEETWEIVEVTPTDDRKQFVNIDHRCRPRQTPVEHHGRQVVIKAKISPARRYKTVNWILRVDPSNRALHFSQAGNPTAVPPLPQPPLPLSHVASIAVARSQTNARGIARVTLDLGLYGGDKFQVSASREVPTGPRPPTASGAALSTGVFEVWRKLWYAQVQMQKGTGGGVWEVPASSLATVQAAFQKCFVELIDSGEKQTGPHQENFETHDSRYRWADRYTSRRFTPWKVVYAAVEFSVPLADAQARTHTQNVTSGAEALAGTFNLYNFRIGRRAARREWFRRATVTDPATGAVTNLNKANFRISQEPYGPTTINVDVTSTGLTPNVGSPLTLDLLYNRSPGYNGWGGTNLHLVICARAMTLSYGANAAVAMASTSIHEPGHALGLVYGLPWETTDAANPSHCGVQKCVLWYQGYTGRPTDFHTADDTGSSVDPNCHTFVRGKNMSRNSMRIWRFPRT